ncbi:efflux RND transporter periplasmic adaptor subunit [Cupriavidus sp.]|uniref:efflux RND transporter periplasmic adaptor subunit n=1 Tax=Cupriavidus sp. TaxID=1873897 RepID=UPI0025B90B26|nr:efflux RND transporter periplasmic adaptor subunit [Cupriavidus sp.]MCA3190921.1 efflux RND transporter periplasmic adaptor subunit [Cupriavidus sp.]MCA3196528.1 efflux RND transporter periplasmic adaptor subunit [Cupriavidus sp.]MCA3205418.1 efflux RND transporter periplasmic adaptor subunit [Cupriavidus sp.]MCA3206210.1 efflux RND transporter periplasmic adaptor subunit [Cupriavidus sp.]
MTLTRKQGVAMAAIVAAGLIAALALLLTNRGSGPAHDHAGEGAAAGQGAASAASAAHANEPPGLIPMTPEQIRNANLGIAKAAPGKIRSAVEFPGEIRFNEDRTAHVVPRVAGVAESVVANLGQRVKKGDLLAVFASTQLSDQRSELLAAQRRLELARTTYGREKKLWEDKVSAEQDFLAARTALQEAEIAEANARQKLTAIGATASARAINQFELRAPFDGIVVEKHLALGEAVAAETAVFTISDLNTVWAEFVIAAKDLNHVRLGESVRVTSAAFDGTAEGKISYVGALLGQQTRTATARVTLSNPQMAWRPGLFVTVSVATGETDAAVVIDSEALQIDDGRQMVFAEVPGGFAARPVKTGRSDGKRIEIVDGLAPGTRYVSANSFVLKAEQGKAGAEHTH